jgi:ABC-type polysaccharide/polyol phosphate export permease/Flp pilus assembly protein TadD
LNPEDPTISQLAVDRASVGPGGDDGAPDTDAGRHCRLAEALLHNGRRAEAVAYCRRALPGAAGDPALLRICAWVFSNCGCHDEAAAAYGAVLRLCPDWIEGYRHASGALAAAGRTEEAIAAATRASELAPHQAEFARHAGALLLSAGRAQEAAFYLGQAAALQPGDAALAADAAEALMRCGRVAEAARVLRAAAAGGDPRLLRVLSAAEMMCGRLEAALEAVDGALAGAPDNAEHHLHRGHLLWRLGDSAAAARAFDRAASLDPASLELQRARMSFYLAAGLVTEATAAGGELLHRFPDDRPAAEAMLHLLGHRLDAIDGEFVVLSEGAERARRPLRPLPGLLQRLQTQRRVIGALILRETRTRFADVRLGYAWALIEPILHIALLSVMFAVLMHGRPPIGRHFFIFYYTGLIPYHMFVHTSSGMSHAITGNAPLLELPPVTTFDVIAARGLLEMMTDVIVAVALLAAFGAIGVAQMPDDLWSVAMALLACAALGVGCGYVNAVLTVFFRSWEKAFNQLTRVLYFVSGIFYVPAMMPDWARDALAWNPVMQAVDWFRAGFFASYRPHWLDRPYLVAIAILALLCGLALERGLRRRLKAPL